MNIIMGRSLKIGQSTHQSLKLRFPLANIYHCPLFTEKITPLSLKKQPSFALIITSQNAVDSLLKGHSDFDIPIFLVGEKTYQYAQKRGFCHLFPPYANVAQLTEELQFQSQFDRLIYIRGQKVRADLCQILGKNQNISHMIAYHMLEQSRAFAQLPDDIEDAENIILSYSLEQSKAIEKLLPLKNFKKTRIIGISKFVSRVFKNYPNLHIDYAQTASESAIFELIHKKYPI